MNDKYNVTSVANENILQEKRILTVSNLENSLVREAVPDEAMNDYQLTKEMETYVSKQMSHYINDKVWADTMLMNNPNTIKCTYSVVMLAQSSPQGGVEHALKREERSDVGSSARVKKYMTLLT